MAIISEPLLKRLYMERGLTDREIANFMGFDRNYISKLREMYGIETRENTGTKGERYVKRKLASLGFLVKDMNEKNKTSSFDLLLNNKIKIEVKTALINDSDCYKFQLSEKEENQNIISQNRIKLANGRTRKIYKNTCDFIVFVGIRGSSVISLIIPSGEINNKLQTLSFPASGKSKYRQYLNNWEQLKKFQASSEAI